MSESDKFYFYLYYACVGFFTDDIYGDLNTDEIKQFKYKFANACKDFKFYLFGEKISYDIDKLKEKIQDIENCIFKALNDEGEFIITIMNGIINRHCIEHNNLGINKLFTKYGVQMLLIFGLENNFNKDELHKIIEAKLDSHEISLLNSLESGKILYTNLNINFYKTLIEYDKDKIKDILIFLIGEVAYKRIVDKFVINSGFIIIIKIIEFLLNKEYIQKDFNHYRSRYVVNSILPIKLKNAIQNLDYKIKIELIEFLRSKPDFLEMLESDEYGRNEVYELINLNYLDPKSVQIKNKNNLIYIYI
jgi:hypothetical protein